MTMQQPPDEVSMPQPSHDAASTQPKSTRRHFLKGVGTTAKSALALTGAASLGSFVSACGGAPNVNTGKGQVSLTWYREGNPDEAALAKKIADQFMQKNPDIKIVIQQGNSGNHLQKFNTELAGGSPPDLIHMWELDYGSYAKKGVFANLSDFIKNDQQFQDQVMSQEYKPVIDMFTWEGKLYVIPEQVTNTVLFYNVDHVKEAGLEMPTSWDDATWTWDKFLDYAKKLTKTSGGRTTRYGFAEMWWWPLTASNVITAANGGNWFDNPIEPPAGASNLSDPKIAKAIQWYADLSNVHKVAASAQSLQSQAGFQLFQTGKASMGIVGHWFYGAFATTSGLHFDIAPIPIGPDGGSVSRTNTGGTGISISAKTRYPEQAWLFAKYWGSPEAMKTRGIWLPTLQNIGNSPDYLKSNSAMAHAKLFLDILQPGRVHSLPISPAYANFSVPYGTVLTDIWQGKTTAAKALPGLDKTINQDIQQYG